MAIALVQSQVTSPSAQTGSITVAFPSNVTAGNLLTVSIAYWKPGAAPTISTPTDTLTHTYTAMGAQLTSVENGLRSYYVANCSGGANTVTIGLSAYGAGSDITVVIAEWSGAATSSVLGNHTGSTGTAPSGNTFTAGAVTTTAADEMVYSAMAHAGVNGTISEDGGNGWSLVQKNEGGTSDMPIGVAYQVFASAGSYDHAWWINGQNVRYMAHNTAFKAAGAVGGSATYAGACGCGVF